MCIRDRGIVAAAVESVGADAAEVADTGKRNIEQTIEKLPDVYKRQGRHQGAARGLSWREHRRRGLRPRRERGQPTQPHQADACLLYTSRCV